MYAIAFDLKTDTVKQEYDDPYNKAYDEIRQELETFGFDLMQGSMYINHSDKDNFTTVYKAINRLPKINWFRQSVRDIKALKFEDWSDFTDVVKEG